MKTTFHLFLAGLLMIVALFWVGCTNFAEPQAAATPLATAEPSEEAQYIVGKWTVNDGRFGHKIFDFQDNGRLLIEDVETGDTIDMTYLFVTENSFTMSGYDDFNGAATVNFYDDKMDLTITFDGNIFGELYVFTREEEPLE